MRRIQNGIAAVITKEKLFNRRVVLGGFIILASAFASYMTMATYVPSLVHAHESQDVERRENRSALAATSAKSDDQSEASTDQDSQSANGSESESNGDGNGQTEQPSGETAARENNSEPVRGETPKEIAAPPVTAPREVIADAPAEREVRRNDSKPSPVVASRFQADGCSKRGTSTLRHHNKQVRWNNYGEFGNGTKGNCIKSIQRKLNQYCTNKLGVDGQYGPRTSSAVRAYQHYMRSLGGITVNGSQIHVDGIAGAQTFALMQEFTTNKSFLKC